MDFSTPDHLQALLGNVRAFLERAVYPLEGRLGKQPFRELAPELHRLRDEVKASGMWAPQLTKEYGGMGLSFLDFARVSEELGRSPLGHYIFNCQAPDAGNMELLLEFATEEQKRRWLEPLCRGDLRSCFAMTEPDFPGSNPSWMATTAKRDGDQYVLNGRKWFTSSADGSAFAIVMAITNPDVEPHRRASLFIVPTNTPGFRFIRNIPCMGHAGDDWDSHAEIAFVNCRVPGAHRLGDEGAGFSLAQARLGPGRIHHCMRWIGVAERAFDLMCQRAATRELAPGDKLASRQTVQNWIAESRAEILASRLMVMNAAWNIDTFGAKQAREEVSLIKFSVAKTMMDVIDRAIQVHGALGISDDTVLSYFYRAGRAARIYDGPDEVHKSVVARLALKRYGHVIG
jgi:alkylation response protein AidB-like acyl-CoA dehydrogenase